MRPQQPPNDVSDDVYDPYMMLVSYRFNLV